MVTSRCAFLYCRITTTAALNRDKESDGDGSAAGRFLLRLTHPSRSKVRRDRSPKPRTWKSAQIDWVKGQMSKGIVLLSMDVS